MLPKVVTLDSSDDEEGVASSTPAALPPPKPQMQQTSGAITTPLPTHQSLEYRSFWKAGAYEINTNIKFTPEQGQLEHARVHPKFLHSNATSHKWAFGAIAELMDNAVDEIHSGATYVKVDKIDISKDNSPALLFQDDGGGMDPEGIRKCMSLGYSSKKANTTIGQYGNGFKTSTMRLGADVIVFSRAKCKGKATQSVGLLSYTYLRRTGQDDVIVPMVDFDVSSHWAEPIIYSSQDDWTANLKIILEWSPFASKDELMQQFEDIGTHGTKIVIYNLWLNDEGIYELSFDDDDEDIRLRDETNSGVTKLNKRALELRSHISYRIRYSLRAYASVLYLRKFKNFNIILRGKPVEQYNIAGELKYSKVVTYKPQLAMAVNEVTVETTIGFIKEAPSLPVSGFNVYHKNRLIRPFWRVTSDGTSKGHGVVGVLEANFIEPAHDKQDFERSSLFIRLETRLKQMIMEYWKGHCHHFGFQPPGFNPQKQSRVQLPAGFPPNVFQEVRLDQSAVGLAANKALDLSKGPPGTGFRTTVQNTSPPVQPIISLEDDLYDDTTSADPRSLSIEQICEENIQLFMRCEEHIQKEAELNQTIQELEKELEEAKSKRDQLALQLQMKRKQMTL